MLCNCCLTLADLAYILVLDDPQVNLAPVCYGSCKAIPVAFHVLPMRETHITHYVSADYVSILGVTVPSFRWMVIVREKFLDFFEDISLVDVILQCEILAPLHKLLRPLFAVLNLCLSLNSLT